MGIVDLSAPSTAAIIDTPAGFAVTPGEDEVNNGSEGSVLGAAFRQDNSIGSFLSNEVNDSPFMPMDESFNPWDAIKGTKYEARWKSFADISNAETAEQMKRQIDREEEDRKTLQAAPLWQSVPAQMLAGAADWPTLAPAGTIVSGAKGGAGIARSALSVGAAAGGSAAAQEAGLHSTQETRTLSESGLNIGASFVLGNILGAAGGKLLSNAEWSRAVQAMDADLAKLRQTGAPVPVEGGSIPFPAGASAIEPMDIEGNAIAGKAAGAVAAATARLNPALRILQSPSSATREVGTQLFENSLYLKKNMEGVASEPAVETLMKGWNAGLAKAVTTTDETFLDYRKAGGQLSRHDFREAVGKAMRRGDEADDPHVTLAAKEWRAKVFDPLKEAAIAAKQLPPDVTVETAASYFSRMWNRPVLVAREGDFKAIASDWITRQAPKWAEEFDKETLAKAAKLTDDKLKEWEVSRRIEREARFGDLKGAVRDIVDEVYDTLTGRVGNGVRPEYVTVKARGPLKERTFNIPDELVEEFLESDVDLVGRRYARVMGADVEMARKFGSTDMAEQIQKIRDDYKQLRAGLSDEKQLTKLGEAEKADIRDIEALRDLLRGTRQESPIERNYARITRVANHLNYIRSMGEVVLASLTDAIRPAMVHGLGQFMQTVPQLLTNLKGIKLSVAEAKLAGNVVERVLGHRLATISEIIDPYASRGPVEAFIENGTNVASKWNGIRIWTDMMKSVASVMTQNRILGNVDKLVATDSIAAFHGSPFSFDRFSAKQIGAGEGHQSYGHGLYFAENPKVAKTYVTSYGRETVGGRPFDPENHIHRAAELISQHGRGALAEAERLVAADPVDDFYAKVVSAIKGGNVPSIDTGAASLYRVELRTKRDNLLDLDQPLSKQGKNVQTALRSAMEKSPNADWFRARGDALTGEEIYDMLGNTPGGKLADREKASQILQEEGLAGLQYLDQGSRGSKKGTRNFVVFDDSLVSITHKNGAPVGGGPDDIASRWAALPKKERAYLAYLGIDQSMAERVAKQFQMHGETVDGVKVANTGQWTDPVAVRTYRAAMNKDVDSIIVQKSVADVPLFASTPTGRMLLQFKSFALASHQRILLRGLQEDQTRFIGGTVAMTAMGMLVTYLKAISGNRTEKQSNFFDNPGWWIGEGLDRSGVMAVPMELSNTFERFSGTNPIKAPLKLMDEGSALSQKNQGRNEVGALLGPTAGFAQDIMTAGAIPKRMYEGEEISQGQANSAERLAPFNSFPGIRQMLRYIVNVPD